MWIEITINISDESLPLSRLVRDVWIEIANRKQVNTVGKVTSRKRRVD